MSLRLKVGTVISQGDFMQGGTFKVAFKLDDKQGEPVRYVSPYGSSNAAFVAIPTAGSQVLCAYEDSVAKEGEMIKGYYYLGSLMGTLPGSNRTMPRDPNAPLESPSTPYVSKDSEGTHGPDIAPGTAPMILAEDQGPWPPRFKDLYDGKGVIPEKIGLTGVRADAFTIANRYRGNAGPDPYQDHAITMISGSGKQIRCVDSPMVDGIVMTNEHRGKDYFIWSTGMSKESPFSEGEYHMRTHGPVNLYTLLNRFHIWVEDGLNIEIENKSTGSKAYGDDLGSNPAGPPGGGGQGLGDPGSGGYKASRQGVYGNETTGCIQLNSHHNNVSIDANEIDSVIRIITPGENSRVIVESGGTLDLFSTKKLTVQSDLEVEINAPTVDINGSQFVYVDGGQVHLNMPHLPPPEL